MSRRPAIIAKDKRNLERGLKIEKLSVVPIIGPMLLKQLSTPLTMVIKLLLSKLTIKISAAIIII